jgi:hypothetical protein
MLMQRMNFVLLTAAVLTGALARGSTREDQDNPKQGLERTWQRGSLELTLSLSDVSPFVSDDVSVHLRVAGPAGAEIELPKLESLGKEFQVSDVKKTGPSSESDGQDVWDLYFKLEVLRATQAELPALTVRYRTSPESDWLDASTESVPIEFRSMLGADPESAEPRSNPSPLDWPIGWVMWALALLSLVAIVLLAIGAWINRRARSRGVRPIERISTYRKALQGILRIEAAGYLERGEVERFYTELSGVIRHYIEDRFGLRAPEQTTEEFFQELTRQPVLVEKQRDALGAFLEQCDLVKFAKVRPTTQEGKSALSAARAFVEATRDDSVFIEVVRETVNVSET